MPAFRPPAPSRFADRAEAGRVLAPLVSAALADRAERSAGVLPVVLAVDPGGVAVGAPVSELLGAEARTLPVHRTETGVQVDAPADLAGRVVVVVDDGVETGTAARAVAAALRTAGVARLVLAVPVCPREVQADLARRYDVLVAAVRPLARRSLRWHYLTY